MTVSDFRSIFSITSSIGVVLLYVLTVIARIETLGCRERKSSNRGRGMSSLIWKDHNLGKVVIFSNVFHRKLVEVAWKEQSVSSSRNCDTPNRSGRKGVLFSPLYRQVGQVPSRVGIYWWHKNIDVIFACEKGCKHEVFTLNRYQSR